MKEKSYHTIRQLEIGNTKIELCIENKPTEEQIKRRLTQIYDVINDIASKAEKRGINTTKWFYTEKQLNKLRLNAENHFI